ncbi:MAG: N-acetyltransferase [Proteobacteria bacterium]|nr:N-acetyltransferase [Pseudomonadota bacterium]
MPDGGEAVSVQVLGAIAEAPAAAWDACAGADNPFVGHAFLSALEDSGSAVAENGWQPRHLVIPDRDGGFLGVVPLYLKSHSYGEYVFDWGWADAYERAGGAYYPKLQACVPFTPVTGPRLLVRPGAEAEAVSAALVAGLTEVARRTQVSSLHVTFCERAEWRRLGDAGFLQRTGRQFHWHNRGYDSFDAFLDGLTSRKRKMIRKERRKVAESGITLRALRGEAIEPRHWDAFHRFYLATADRKWGSPYLTRDFFHRLGETLTERVVLVVAEDRGEMIAAALNLLGEDALYGRNWGALGDYRFLHFEACYYQAIEFAIEHGLARVEAGAQGEHKIQRGYMPVETYSAHWIADPGFREAVENYLAHERRGIAGEIAGLATFGPFRQDRD